jgi:hypothetical protein
MLGVGSAVESKLEILLAFPKLLRRWPENLLMLIRHCFLVIVVVLGVVWLEIGGIAVLVEQEFGEIIVLEGELKTGGLVVVEGKQSHSKGVNHPLGLQLQLGHHCRSVRPHLAHHLIGVVQAPGSVGAGVQVVLRTVVHSPLASWQQAAFGYFLHLFLGLAHSFEVVGMLFLIYIVRVFVDAEGEEGCPGEDAPKAQSSHHSHVII